MAVGPLGFAIFALMNFAFVLTLAVFAAWLERAWTRDASRRKTEQVVALLLGLLALVGLVNIVLRRARRDADAPEAVGVGHAMGAVRRQDLRQNRPRLGSRGQAAALSADAAASGRAVRP